MILLHRPSKTTSPSTDYINTPKLGDYTEPLERGQISASPYQTFPLFLPPLSLLSPRSIISSSLDHCLLPNQLSSAIFFCFGGENAVENFSNDRGTRHLGELADWQAVSYQSFPSPGMRFPALVCP